MNIKQLKDSNGSVYSVTLEEYIFDENGNLAEYTDSMLYSKNPLTQDNYDPNFINHKIKEIQNKINEIESNSSEILDKFNKFQNSYDSNLLTTTKTVVGSINEINNGISSIVDSNTFLNKINSLKSELENLYNDGLNLKNTMVSSLTNKNVPCSINDSFESLVNKVSKLDEQGKIPSNITLGDMYILADPMPGKRYGHASAVYNNKIYVFGGQTDSHYNYEKSVFCYDYDTNKWKKLITEIPNGKYDHSATIYNGKAYIIGGDSYYTDNFCYDISLNSWTTKASLSSGICRHRAEIIDGKIYVFAGLNSSYNTSKVTYCYDVSTNTWSSKASLAINNYYYATAVLNGKIYLFGGNTGSLTNKCYYYTPSSNSFTTLSLDFPAINLHTAVNLNNTIYLHGGVNANNYRIMACTYNEGDSKVTYLSDGDLYCPYPVLRHTAEVIDGKIFLIGGVSNDNYARQTSTEAVFCMCMV